jgi:ABC-type bacteriocin/lantibiotic exporter with double-glycine peptidase domain
MNVISDLIKKFIYDNNLKIILLIFISLLINCLKINVISYVTAQIIKSINEKNMDNTFRLFYYFTIIIILYILLYNFYEYLQIKILSKIRYWIRQQLIEYLLKINNNRYSEINFTKLNSPIYRMSNTIFYIFNYVITNFIPNITMILIILLFFIFKNLNIGLIFLVGNLIAFIYFYYISGNIIKQNKIYEEDSVISENIIVEILNNIDKIIFRGNVENEINNHNDLCDKTVNSAIKFYKEFNYYCFIMSVIIIITILIIIYYLIKLFYNNSLNATLFITFFTILLLYRDLIITTINGLPNLFEFYGKYQGATKLFNKMDFKKEEIEEVLNNKNSKIKPKLNYNKIEYKNVYFKYKHNNKYILDNFNLKLNTENKIIGILGNSGNGKSTFAKLLVKLYNYDGNIYIDDIDIKNIDTTYLRKNILFINQNSKLFDKKIIENILYGCDNEDVCYEQLSHIMKHKKITDIFKDIDIYNKNAGYSGENISGGQRQIVNIINGLITPSNITILDEPTNGLDGELKENIIEIIKYFKKFKKCIIIITHDEDIKRIFDETIYI